MSSPPKIAVVDDDDAVLASIDSLIRSWGFDVSVFSSAEEFLNSIDFAKADCLITDIQMPNMSGLDLHERLMAQGIHIPTIFITAYPTESLRKRSMTGSALCFLPKPFHVETLFDCLASALV